MNFKTFKKLILDYRTKKIDRETFCNLWNAEQKKIKMELPNALSLD